jgi:hypothetical protein
VILVDANILIYAYNPDSEHHYRAKDWLEDAFSQPEPIKLAWQSILAFLRITTNIHVFRRPFSTIEAISIVSLWLEQPCVAVLHPGERHWETLSKLMEDTQIRGPLVPDAHLAALALEHGAAICSHDGDFTRFPALRVIDPCATAKG